MSATKRLDLVQVGEKKELDIYRDTPVRYLGYANEVGEAFRAIIGSKWVAATYGVATTYVLADTCDKTYKTYISNKQDPNVIKKSIFTAADSFIWQILASVAIPGFTINRVCAGSNYLLKKTGKLPPKQRTWIVTAIGLSAIPFIIKPIDRLTDRLLDETLRKIEPK